jgi:4-hydroxy-3-polyprenylbenzoate decarboxylase
MHRARGDSDTILARFRLAFRPTVLHVIVPSRADLSRIPLRQAEPMTAATARRKRLIVALTGASGVIYGIRALEILRRQPGIETHVILSAAAARTVMAETAHGIDEVRALADATYNPKDIGAAIASGSFKTEGMLVAPCSVRTLSGVAHCYDEELVVRAADVCLKERRRVVLLFRETPLHAGHIELMARATRNGAIVMPPVPAFYDHPRSVDDIVTQTVGRALDLFGIDAGVVRRWQDPDTRAAAGSRSAADASAEP